jgi:mitosis inhibitor protein kinase SWE1
VGFLKRKQHLILATRLRLLEEAELLQRVAGHRNVLQYVDSWEQDQSLFLLSEFCALGNFAHFLAEYGRRFERLDEFRCWKVLAELIAVGLFSS